MPDDLDDALLAAHAAADKVALMRLYARAGDLRAASGRAAAACFFWTQAYVWALDAGASEAAELRRRLRAHGAEE
ncbi:hypothetical protein [Frigidibacter sp. ROC022]|uniref:hypothetical protein n=1 Tax=Frigidibacter sp. ROC022 TaxID=2971796 RepID=UPI00215B5050|nr:hypothetical protein [Frigidibacter sp. ROC022]MCR8725056.1 hypothetical protein [Frigidibacter sp. ROC022]